MLPFHLPESRKLPMLNFHNYQEQRFRAFCSSVKAMSVEPRDDLDRLQRAKQQQLQPKLKGPKASPTVLLNPFLAARTVQQMMDIMERIMEDPVAYSSSSPLIVTRDGDEYSKGKIPWAIKEGEKDYNMRFNMPGMNRNDVKVRIEENMIVVKAEKATKQNDHQLHGNEEASLENEECPAKSYGWYSHRIALPENLQILPAKYPAV